MGKNKKEKTELKQYKNESTNKDFISWVNSLDIKFQENTTFGKYKADIYFPEYNIAIDYVKLYEGSELYYEKKYRVNKLFFFRDLGIQLVTIFECEWREKQDIVKSILCAKINKFKRKIFARKCEIREIETEEYKEFVLNNHIQGYVAGKIKIGLFYNDELVQLCSFGKSRFKRNEVELIRSCSKKFTQVVGGFSKIVKYYVTQYKVETLVSFADLRYFDAHGYINWDIIDICYPNYWYWDQNQMKLESRIKYQKHKLITLLKKFDIKKTEVENMYDNGYIRIWDCRKL